jgi:hypothetical protein
VIEGVEARCLVGFWRFFIHFYLIPPLAHTNFGSGSSEWRFLDMGAACHHGGCFIRYTVARAIRKTSFNPQVHVNVFFLGLADSDFLVRDDHAWP